MGTFCTNITLVGADPVAVEQLLVDAGRAAFVGSWDGDTVVYDERGEAQDGSHAALAQELSAVLGCVAVASLNHDDDILYLQVFERGEVRGEYNSAPDYFDDGGDGMAVGPDTAIDDIPRIGLAAGPDPQRWLLGLDPATLVRLVGRGDADRLAGIAAGDALFASDLHAEILDELGLPQAACGTGYRYLTNGELPEDADAGGLHEVPRT